MARNLKALGLTLVTVVACAATTTSSAQAVDVGTIDGAAEKATLTGISHNNVLKITTPGTNTVVGKWECTTSSFTATGVEGASQMTGTASYIGQVNQTPHGTACSSSFGTITVDLNGCDYVLTGNTTGDHGAQVDAYGIGWVVCPAGKEIEITGACAIKIPAQTPTEGGGQATNQLDGTVWDVLVQIQITGVTINPVHSFGCTLAHVTHGWVGDYEGSVTMTGYADTGTHTHNNVQVGITVSS